MQEDQDDHLFMFFILQDFRVNSFEQMCINYANESLQYYFNKHIFALEQQEYSKEQILWSNITYHDNQPVLDLIAKKPNGIIHVLDDESNFPKVSTQSLTLSLTPSVFLCHILRPLQFICD